jgi:hypothetical protein
MRGIREDQLLNGYMTIDMVTIEHLQYISNVYIFYIHWHRELDGISLVNLIGVMGG